VRGDKALVHERSSALVAFATERGFPHLQATGTFFHGWARGAGGAVDEGIEEMRRGLTAKRAGGAEIKVPYYLGLLATVCLRARRRAEALSLLAEGLHRVDRTGERWFEAELHRIKGDVLRRAPEVDPAEAETCLRKAIAVAQGQGAKLWELRATMSLAQLWRDQGRRAEAHDLLAPVFGWFTEGFDTADLKEARALLDELA
jgi:predicted ATPase